MPVLMLSIKSLCNVHLYAAANRNKKTESEKEKKTENRRMIVD